MLRSCCELGVHLSVLYYQAPLALCYLGLPPGVAIMPDACRILFESSVSELPFDDVRIFVAFVVLASLWEHLKLPLRLTRAEFNQWIGNGRLLCIGILGGNCRRKASSLHLGHAEAGNALYTAHLYPPLSPIRALSVARGACSYCDIDLLICISLSS